MKRLILILALCSPIMAQYESPLNIFLDQLPHMLKELNEEQMREEALNYQRQQTLINAERLRLERERFEYEKNRDEREEIEAFREAGFDLVDNNSDGKYDTYSLDNSGDGKYNIVAIDEDFDGSIDIIKFYDDEDNSVDRILYDNDNNGTLEYWLFDNDGDGNWDEAGIDTDGDMLPNVRYPYVAKQ